MGEECGGERKRRPDSRSLRRPAAQRQQEPCPREQGENEIGEGDPSTDRAVIERDRIASAAMRPRIQSITEPFRSNACMFAGSRERRVQADDGEIGRALARAAQQPRHQRELQRKRTPTAIALTGRSHVTSSAITIACGAAMTMQARRAAGSTPRRTGSDPTPARRSPSTLSQSSHEASARDGRALRRGRQNASNDPSRA